MKLFFRRALTPAAVFFASAVLAHAHPGHEGDHDFTWDFSHLAAHPGATLFCFGVLGVIAWGLWRAFRPDEPARVPIRVRADLPPRRQ